jgi:hypothetical protein
MRVAALSMEEGATEFSLQLLDCPRQSRLRHVASLCRFGEVEVLCDRQEISDVMHFHLDRPAFAVRNKGRGSRQDDQSMGTHQS